MPENNLHIVKGNTISKEKLFAYLRNQLNDTEKILIEKLIAEDPFLQDAIEGLKSADLNTIEATLNTIYTKIDLRAPQSKTVFLSTTFKRYAAAACLLAFVGLTWVMMNRLQTKNRTEIAAEPSNNNNIQNNSSELDDSSDMGSGNFSSDSISMDELNNELKHDQEPVIAMSTITREIDIDAFSLTENSEKKEEITSELFIGPPGDSDLKSITLDSDLVSENETIKNKELSSAPKVNAESVDVLSDKTYSNEVTSLDEIEIKKTREKNTKSDKTKSSNDDKVSAGETMTQEERIVYGFVAIMPQFPGGSDSLNQFLVNNLNTNCEGRTNCTSETVFVKFIINEDGSVSNAEIMKPLNYIFNDEVLRVVNSMPAWIPGQQDGNTVPVYFTLKVNIDID